MQEIVFVTGADRGLGQGMTAGLLEMGKRVFAGQYMPDWPELGQLAERYPEQLTIVPCDVSSQASLDAAAEMVASQVGRLDVLINNAGVRGGDSDFYTGTDYATALASYNINSLGPIRAVHAFLPLLDNGPHKRLCFVSSEAGSIALAHRTDNAPYCMTKATLNMAVRIMHNDLRPQGYSFRLYHPGWVRGYMGGVKSTKGELEPEVAAAYALPFFLGERENEERLALVDYTGHEFPF